MKIKTCLLVFGIGALIAVNAFASDPCEKPAIDAATKWAVKNHRWAGPATVAGFATDRQGRTVMKIHLLSEDGECWTNVDVSVQEAADDSCKVIHVEENTSAESCG